MQSKAIYKTLLIRHGSQSAPLNPSLPLCVLWHYRTFYIRLRRKVIQDDRHVQLGNGLLKTFCQWFYYSQRHNEMN